MLLVSIAATMALWGWLNDWETAAIIIAVLFIHESGHAVMMRVFGYRDMSMFFIPMMGAVVTGNAKDMPAWKQAVILFAGPVPGLLLGLWLLNDPYSFPHVNFLASAAMISFYINLFNLLPIAALDGGRLVEILLLYRWPYSLLVFALLGFIAIAALLLWLGSKSWLILVLLALNARGQWRVTQLRVAWRKYAGPTHTLEDVFAIAQQKLGNTSFLRQYGAVRAVYEPATVRPATVKEGILIITTLIMLWAASGYSYAHYESASLARKAFDSAYLQYTDADNSG